jgi:hypothetical protein
MQRRKVKPPSLTERAEAAFAQACRKVVERARQTGTPIVVWKDGHLEKISSERAAQASAADQTDSAIAW